MNKYIFINNFHDFMCQNVRESYEHAAERWGATIVENTEVGSIPNLVDDKFENIDDRFEDNDLIMVADADILYRADAPSPFQFGTDFGISVCTDMQALPYDLRDTWGASTLQGLYWWAIKLDIHPHNLFPLNAGVVIGTKKNLVTVGSIYKELGQHTKWDPAKTTQPILSAAIHISQIPLIVMPDWVNYINPYKKNGDRPIVTNYPMPSFSMHLAGIPNPGKNDVLNGMDWRLIPEI